MQLVGKCVPPFEPVVVHEDGHELPANAEGRLFFRDVNGRRIDYHSDAGKSAAA